MNKHFLQALIVLFACTIILQVSYSQSKQPTLEIYFLKTPQGVGLYAPFLVDLDTLKLEDKPFITGEDIASFWPGVLHIKKHVKMPRRRKRLLHCYFIIVVNVEREFMGNFRSVGSSRGPGEATTQMRQEITEIRIPIHCKRLNTYLRWLYKQGKHKPTPE